MFKSLAYIIFQNDKKAILFQNLHCALPQIAWTSNPRQNYAVMVRGGYRANLKGGQLVVGALKDFQKLVTRVRCMQQFQIPFQNKQHNFEVLLEAN